MIKNLKAIDSNTTLTMPISNLDILILLKYDFDYNKAFMNNCDVELEYESFILNHQNPSSPFEKYNLFENYVIYLDESTEKRINFEIVHYKDDYAKKHLQMDIFHLPK